MVICLSEKRGHVYDKEEVLSIVKQIVDDPVHGMGASIRWIGGRVLSDETVVVITRFVDGKNVFGNRFDVDKFASDIKPSPMPVKELAYELVEHIVEPFGRAQLMNVDWADGIIEDPDRILWTTWV